MSKRVSYKFLARQHNLLMKLEKAMLAEHPNSAGLLNEYVCDKCKSKVTTLYGTAGVTPFKMDCLRKGCDGLMTSFFPQTKQGEGSDEPTYIWIRPDLRWLKKHRKHLQLLEHVWAGGLIIHKIKKNEQIRTGLQKVT